MNIPDWISEKTRTKALDVAQGLDKEHQPEPAVLLAMLTSAIKAEREAAKDHVRHAVNRAYYAKKLQEHAHVNQELAAQQLAERANRGEP